MSEMIERVARALCADAGTDPDGRFLDLDNKPTLGWRLYQRDARTAIAAMREPTERMRWAWVNAGPPHGEAGSDAACALADWQAMIDEALKA